MTPYSDVTCRTGSQARLGETKVKELLAKYGAKMRDGFKTQHPSMVLNPVQCTAAYVENTSTVPGPQFCNHLVFNPVLFVNTKSVNVVTYLNSQKR
jgi:hypothetical protein